MAAKGNMSGATGLWNLHSGWLKVSPSKSGFEGYKKDTSLGTPGTKKWKDRWAVVNSNKVCLYMDERCIQETATFALGPGATVTMWESGGPKEPQADKAADEAKWKSKSITGLHIRERLRRMSKKKEAQKMTVLNELLQGTFELKDTKKNMLVAKPKSHSAKECDLWVENMRHAVLMLKGEVRMQGWVLAPEVKEKARGKTALDAGIEKDIVINAVAHNQSKKKKIFARKSSIADQGVKWFCSLKGKTLKFYKDESCDPEHQPNSRCMTISAFTRVEAAGNLKVAILQPDARYPDLASFKATILSQENYNQWLAAISLLVQEQRTLLEKEIANTQRYEKIVVTARACTPTVLGGAHQIANWVDRVKGKELSQVSSCLRCSAQLTNSRTSCRVCGGVFCQYCAPERPCLLAFRKPNHATSAKNVCWTCTYIFEILVPQEIDRKAKESLIDESTAFSQPIEMDEGFTPPDDLNMTKTFLAADGKSKVSHAASQLARVDPEDYPAVLYIRSDRLSEERGYDVWYQFKDEAREREEEAIRAAMSKDLEKHNKEKKTMSVIIAGLKAAAKKSTAEADATSKKHAAALASLKKDNASKRAILISQHKKELDKAQSKIKKLSADLASADRKAAQYTVMKQKLDAASSELKETKRKLQKALKEGGSDKSGGSKGSKATSEQVEKLKSKLQKLEKEHSASEAKLKTTTTTASKRLKEIQKFRTDMKSLKEQLADETKKYEKAEKSSQKHLQELEAVKLKEAEAVKALEQAKADLETAQRAGAQSDITLQESTAKLRGEVAKLQEDRDAKATQLQAIEVRLEKANANAAELKAKQSAQELQIQQLEKELGRKTKSETALQQELESMKDSLTAERKRAQAEMDAVRQKLAEQLADSSSSGDELKSQLAQQQAAYLQLQSEARSNAQALELELDALRARTTDMNGTIAQVEAAHEKVRLRLEEEQRMAEQYRLDAQKSLAEARQEIDQQRSIAGAETERLKASIAEQQAECTRIGLELKSAVDTHQAEIGILRSTTESLKAKVLQRETEKSALQARLDEAHQSAVHQREKAQGELDELRKEMEALTAAQGTAADDLREELKEKEAARLQLQLQLQSQQRTLEMEMDMLNSNGQDLQAKLVASEREKEALRSKIDAGHENLAQQREQARTALEELRQGLSAQLTERNAAADELRTLLAKEEAALRNATMEAESEQGTLNMKITMLQANTSAITGQLNEAEQSQEELRAKLQEERERMRQQRLEAQRQLQVLRDTEAAESREQREESTSLQEAMKKQDAKFKQLVMEKEHMHSSLSKEVDLLREQSASLRASITGRDEAKASVQAELQRERDLAEQRRNEAQAELDRLRSDLTQQLLAKDAVTEEVRSELGQAKLEHSRLEMSMKSAEAALKMELEMARSEALDAKKRMGTAEAALQSVEGKLAKEREDAEKQRQSAELAFRALRDDLNGKIVDHVKVSEDLKAQLNEKEIEKATLEMQMQSEKSSLEAQIALLRGNDEGLRSKLNDSEKSISSLQAQLEAELTKGQQQRLAAQKELSQAKSEAEERLRARDNCEERLRQELVAEKMGSRKLKVQLDSTANMMKTEASLHDKETEDLKAKLRTLTEGQSKLRKELDSISTDSRRAKAELRSELEEASKSAQEQIKAASDARARASVAESRVESLSTEIDSVQEDFQRQLSAFQDSVLQRQEKQQSAWVQERTQAAQALESAEAQLADTQRRLQTEQNEAASVAAMFEELRSEAASNQGKLEAANSKLQESFLFTRISSIVAPVLSDDVLYPSEIYALCHGPAVSAETSLTDKRAVINVILWMSQRYQSVARHDLLTPSMKSILKNFSRNWEEFLHLTKAGLVQAVSQQLEVGKSSEQQSHNDSEAKLTELVEKWAVEILQGLLSLDVNAVDSLFRAGVVSFDLAAKMRHALAQRRITVAHIVSTAAFWSLPSDITRGLTTGCTLHHEDVLSLQKAGLIDDDIAASLLREAADTQLSMRRELGSSDVAAIMKGLEGAEELPYSNHSILWGSMTVKTDEVQKLSTGGKRVDGSPLTVVSAQDFAAAAAVCPIIGAEISVSRINEMTKSGKLPKPVSDELQLPWRQGVDSSIIAHLQAAAMLTPETASLLLSKALEVVHSSQPIDDNSAQQASSTGVARLKAIGRVSLSQLQELRHAKEPANHTPSEWELCLVESFMTLTANDISQAFVSLSSEIVADDKSSAVDFSQYLLELQDLCTQTVQSEPHRTPFHALRRGTCSGGRMILSAEDCKQLNLSLKTLDDHRKEEQSALRLAVQNAQHEASAAQERQSRLEVTSRNQVEKAQAAMHDMKADMRRLQEARDAATTTCRQLRDESTAFQEREDVRMRELNTARHSADQLRSELEFAKQELKDVREEMNTLNLNIGDNKRREQDVATQLQHEKKELELQLESLQEDLREVRAAHEAQRASLLSATSDNSAYEARLEAQGQELDGAQSELQKLTSELAATADGQREAEDQLRHLQLQAKELEGQLQIRSRELERAVEREEELKQVIKEKENSITGTLSSARDEEVRSAQLKAQLAAAHSRVQALEEVEASLRSDLGAQRSLFTEQRDALVRQADAERDEFANNLAALRRELAAQRDAQHQDAEKRRVLEAENVREQETLQHEVQVEKARNNQQHENLREANDALQELREKIARTERQLQQAVEHNRALNDSYTHRTDEMLVSHGQKLEELQQALDRALTERATMAQRLALEELRVREAHQKLLDDAAAARQRQEIERDNERAANAKRVLESERQAAEQVSVLETEMAKAAALYGAEIAQLSREHDIERKRATTAVAQAADIQEKYTNYVEKMQRDAEEAQQSASSAYRQELEALHEKYQEEFHVMVELDKNRAKQNMIAMKRLQTASSRAQEDARLQFDNQHEEARLQFERELKLSRKELELTQRAVAELKVRGDHQAEEVATLKDTLKRQARHYRKRLGTAAASTVAEFDIVRRSLRKIEKAILKHADQFEVLHEFTRGAMAKKVSAVLKYSASDGGSTGSGDQLVPLNSPESAARPQDVQLVVKAFEHWVVPLVAQMLRCLEQREAELHQKDTEWVSAALAAAQAQKAGAVALATAVHQLEEEKQERLGSPRAHPSRKPTPRSVRRTTAAGHSPHSQANAVDALQPSQSPVLESATPTARVPPMPSLPVNAAELLDQEDEDAHSSATLLDRLRRTNRSLQQQLSPSARTSRRTKEL